MELEEKIAAFKEWRRLLEGDLEMVKKDYDELSSKRLKIQQRYDKKMKFFKHLLDNKDKYMKAIYEKFDIIDTELKKLESNPNTQQKETT